MDPLLMLGLFTLAAIPVAIIYAKYSSHRIDREFGRRDEK